MISTSYLRIYQPLGAFSKEEQDGWVAEPREGEPIERLVSRRWLISAQLPEAVAMTETAVVRRVDGEPFVCPSRTRLRMLAGLLAFRASVPEEIADAFVPAGEAYRAARELSELDECKPETRSHILHANWHVPLRWFAAFSDSDRVLVEDRDGLRIRYETRVAGARGRLERALTVLVASGIEDAVTRAVRDLLEWLSGFGDEGLVELDYGSVAQMFEDEELLDDHSAGDVWACLDALEEGSLLRAGEIFSSLVDRWNGVRTSEAVN